MPALPPGPVSLTGAIWNISSRAPRALFDELGDLPPLAVQLLYNRGYQENGHIRRFLDGPSPPHDPYLLDGMAAAVSRIAEAIQGKELIHVYGDFDVDGVTATALLVEALAMLGATARPYIPERFSEGYGLNCEAIDLIGNRGPGLIITADCGTCSADEIARARSHQVDVIVTDHHAWPHGEPVATTGGLAAQCAAAVINPKKPGSGYPFQGLAGVGVAYKLVQALAEEMPDRLPSPEKFLDLVALGTVADMAPLRDENRAFVTDGLVALRQTKRCGLRVLGEIARRPIESIEASDIAFAYGPRLNAAGRLAHAELSLRLLQASQADEAEALARRLDALNLERRRLTDLVIAEASDQVDPSAPLVFVVGSEFPVGVIGLVASHLVKTTGRPAFVATSINGTVRGSARAPEGIPLHDVLATQAGTLNSWGGHARAAGFAVDPDRVHELREGLTRTLAREEGRLPIGKQLEADCRVFPHSITWGTYEMMHDLGPFGESHHEPRFVVENVAVAESRVVASSHLAIRFAEVGQHVDAIWFGRAEVRDQLPPSQRCDVAFRLNRRSFGGETRLQMLIDDVRHAANV